jgi:hypothetical protein
MRVEQFVGTRCFMVAFFVDKKSGWYGLLMEVIGFGQW